MIRPRSHVARLEQLAPLLTVVALLGVACERPGTMPRGWRASQRLVEETVGLETFQFSDAGARRWHGLLYTTAGDSDDGRVAVAIRLTRLPDITPQQ